MLLFLFLKKNRVIENNMDYFPYALYIFYSLIFWQIFVYIITNSCGILNRYTNLLSLNFSREVLLYGSACVSLFNAFLQLFIFTGLALLYRIPLSIGFIFLPFIFFIIVLFSLGLAKIISILSVVTRDVSEGLVVILMFWMFATPAIYNASTDYTHFFNFFNPLQIFIKTAHILWLGEFTKIPAIFYFHCFVAIFIFYLGTYFFRRSIYVSLDRL